MNTAPSHTGDLCSLPSRMLLATDLEDLKQTLPIAIDHALKCKSELTLLHVLPDVNAPDNSYGLLVCGDREGTQHYAGTILENAAKKARAAGVKCHWTTRTGEVAKAIQNAVEEWNPDRLIIGSHSTPKFRQGLLGSIAESIFREIEIPTLAIGPAVRLDGKPFSKPARILFAAALNRESRAVVGSVLEFSILYRAHLTMLHVIPDIATAHPSAVRVRVYAERTFQEIPSGMNTEKLHPSCMIERGQVAETILRIARQGRFDLILLGAVSGSSFRREIVPGPAYGVLCGAPCPVLVLKEATRPAAARLSAAS